MLYYFFISLPVDIFYVHAIPDIQVLQSLCPASELQHGAALEV